MRYPILMGVVALVVAVTFSCNGFAQMPAPDPKIMIGHEASNFTLSTLTGESVTLSSLKGKVVVLDFWATWCRPCRAYLPDLIAVTDEYKDKDVVLYTVNLKEPQENVQRFVELTKLNMKVLLDSTGSVANDYIVSSIPQTVIIGKDGKVQVVHVGAATKMALKKDLDQLVTSAQSTPVVTEPQPPTKPEPTTIPAPKKQPAPGKAKAMKQIGTP